MKDQQVQRGTGASGSDPLRETERRLQAVLDNATVAIFLMDENQQCAYMNRAAEKLTGHTLEETQGRPLHDVIHHTRPDGTPFPVEECPIDRAFPEHNQVQGEEVFVHKDGSFYPVAYTASPIHDEEANVVGTIIEVRDISAEKEADRRQDLLINELNHRVKNTLAAVQAIAAQSFRSVPACEDAREVFDARLRALGEAHSLLTDEQWLGAPMLEIVDRIIRPFGDQAARFQIGGSDVKLPPKLTLALAMTLHELAMNAAKYGALSKDGGTVRIEWTVAEHEDGLVLQLRWVEHGGPVVHPPQERGFGTRLIERGLEREFGGKARLLFEPEGVRCEIEARLPADGPTLVGGLVALHR